VEIGVVGAGRLRERATELLDRLGDAPGIEARRTDLDRDLGAAARLRPQLEGGAKMLDRGIRVDQSLCKADLLEHLRADRLVEPLPEPPTEIPRRRLRGALR